MKSITAFCLFLPVLLSISINSLSQSEDNDRRFDSIYKVTMLDESIYIGEFVARDAEHLTIRSANVGIMEIPLNRIRNIKILSSESMVGGQYWFENPNATRYLVGPTAIPLEKGEGYYQNIYVIIQSFNYGLTKNFSVGGGFDLITPFMREDDVSPFFFLIPKLGFKVSEKVHLGAGLLYANTASFDVSGMFIGYGVITYGSRENNLTGGIGWGAFDGEFSSSPIITFSGMKRLSRKVGFVSENWIITGQNFYGILSYGLRFMSESITVDLAFLNNADIVQEIFIGIPYLDFVVKFGK